MRDIVIKCGKGEVKKTLAYIEKKDRKVKWATGDKPTGWGSLFEIRGVYLIIENDVLTFIGVDELEDFDKKGKTLVSAKEFLGKSKNPAIVIFRRGREVIAKDVTTGNEGIAKCRPSDEFVFKTGASIALARLMAKTPDALNHDVKDEWIKALGLTPVEKRVYTDADRNFKVGDKVTIRQWDDMKKTGRQDCGGNIFDTHHKGCFSTAMKSICGKQVEIIESDPSNNDRFKISAVINGYAKKWWVRTWMIERLVQKPTPSFKVGDYVTLKEGIASGKKYGALTLYSGRMYEYANGKRLEVETASFNGSDEMYHYRCKAADGNYFYYTEAMLDKWDESKIHEGDTVKVINTGLNYSSYPQWVGKHISDPYMAARYCYGSPDTDRKYKVIKIAEHESNGRTLAYIEECDGFVHNRCYLIEVKGLEKA